MTNMIKAFGSRWRFRLHEGSFGAFGQNCTAYILVTTGTCIEIEEKGKSKGLWTPKCDPRCNPGTPGTVRLPIDSFQPDGWFNFWGEPWFFEQEFDRVDDETKGGDPDLPSVGG